MSYRFIQKTLTGHCLKYLCPECREPLKSPLEDAGKSDVCPKCEAAIIVPGSDEVASFNLEQGQKAIDASKAREAAKHSKAREATKHSRAAVDASVASAATEAYNSGLRRPQPLAEKNKQLIKQLSGSPLAVASIVAGILAIISFLALIGSAGMRIYHPWFDTFNLGASADRNLAVQISSACFLTFSLVSAITGCAAALQKGTSK